MRTLLVTAAGAALLVLTVGGCASTVPGQGTLDLAAVPTSAGPTPGPTPDPTEDTGGDTTGTTDTGGDTTGTTDTGGDTTGTTDTGDSGDQRAVADVTERWYHGIAAGDGSAVCSLMTAKARGAVARGGSCPDAVTKTDLTSSQRDAMSKVEVDPDGVTVSGDSAEVPASAVSVGGRSSTSSQSITVAKDGGDWLIDDIG